MNKKNRISLWRRILTFDLFSQRKTVSFEIDPDEVFIDSSNLPQFDVHQFEGRMEKPIKKSAVWGTALVCFLLLVVLLGRAGMLQIVHGASYVEQSERNRLAEQIIFAERGVLYDRNETKIGWNTASSTDEYSHRAYTPGGALAHVTGYISLPKKDPSGVYYQTEAVGLSGVERMFNDILTGQNGTRLVEINALGVVQSENEVVPAQNGKNITLSIDASLTEALYEYIRSLATEIPFAGGAGVIMDVKTGELVALTSYPSFDPTAIVDGRKESLKDTLNNPNAPFLNRIVSGLYTPGSIVKPFMALGALSTGVITPEKEIYSSGSISIPNPYAPGTYSVFNDWRAHGWVDMRRAIAVSSDVYFYEVGGGFQDQPGMGIVNIDRFARLFGFGGTTGFSLAPEKEGTIPTPEWKQKVFNDDWRVGDTYNTVIGQYGFQVTPLQVVRAVAAIANGGHLLTPHIRKNLPAESVSIDIPEGDFKVVQEGMRRSTLEGTSIGLSVPYVHIAGKTGTAELGVGKQYVNSWVTGYWPYEAPRYAFAIIMERGPRTNTLGGTYVMRQFIDWLHGHYPEYLESDTL